MTFDEANRYVARHHRHRGRVVGMKFALAAAVGDKVVGVAIVGRPVSRMLDNGWTVEVLRCCTDGTRNACSFLYGAAWRAARALGYRRLVTYTLDTEGGGSLRGAGWSVVAQTKPEHWGRKNRPRVEKNPLQRKFRWEPVGPPTETEGT